MRPAQPKAFALLTTPVWDTGEMGTEPLFCRHCGFVRPFRRPGAQHHQHLLATVFTLGLWSIGWLIATVRESQRPWRCTICQTRYGSLRKGVRRSPAASAPRLRRSSVGSLGSESKR